MARAARPGTRPGSNRTRRGTKGWRLQIGDEEWKLYTSDIGPEDDFLVRRATNGVPLSKFLTDETFGLDSAGVVQWMARRKAGEKRLTLQRVLEEMPSYEEIAELADRDEFILEEFDDAEYDVDEVLDDPVDGEVLPDPLSSAES